MSVMDVRRLVRALGVGALVFLVLGGGFGLVSADGGGAEPDQEAATIPRPGPGDRAHYDLVEVDSRGDLLRRSRLDDATVTVEWLEARRVAAPDHTVRDAHILAVTYRSDSYERARDVAYDAATGLPLSAGLAARAPYETTALDLPFVSGPEPEAEGEVQARIDVQRTFDALCGLRADLQGRAVRPGDDVTVFGACDAEGTAKATAFKVHGWVDLDGQRVLRVDEQGGLGLRLYYDPELPVPVRADGRFPTAIDQGWAQGRHFQIRLQGFQDGGQEYPAASAGPLGAPPVLDRAPVTPWMVDDSGVGVAFPLSQAYAAAMDEASYPPESETLPDWLAYHDDAYLGFAWSFLGSDSRGTEYPLWALVWGDGDDEFAVYVTHEPALLLLDDGLLPRQAVAQPTELQGGLDLPDRRDLPRTLPTIAALWPHGDAVMADLLDGPANGYGFQVFCADDDCRDPIVGVHVGHSSGASGPFGVSLESSFQDQSGRLGMLAVDEAGAPLFTLFLHSSQRAPFPVLPPSEAPPRSQSAGPAATVLGAASWSVPAPEAVAGVGLLATLAGLAYYLWPAVKGGAGAMGLFSRIEPEKVLEQPSRRALHQLIEANPGVHFQELLRRTGFGNGQLDHHLRKLVDAGLVTRVQGSQHACYFVKGQQDRRVMAAAPLLRSHGGRGILQALHESPGASSRDLATRLGLAPGTVTYHVKRLRDAGLLQSAGGSLHLTETGQAAAGLVA